MSYKIALYNLWTELLETTKDKKYEVNFLNDTYEIDIDKQLILSYSCNTSAPEDISILLLSYLLKKLKNEIPQQESELITFNQLPDGKFLYSRFKERAILPLIRKYSSKPEYIFDIINRFKARRSNIAEYAVELDVFDEIKITIVLYPGDEEVPSEANFLFDRGISKIFTVEEIEVLCIEIAKLL